MRYAAPGRRRRRTGRSSVARCPLARPGRRFGHVVSRRGGDEDRPVRPQPKPTSQGPHHDRGEPPRPAILAAHQQTIAEHRRLVAQVLRYLAVVLVAVAGTVFGLMVLAYLVSGDSRYDRDWPGRYWFAVLPLLVAAVGLKATGDRSRTLVRFLTKARPSTGTRADRGAPDVRRCRPHGRTQLLPSRCVARAHSVVVASEVCGHTEPHATQNSFPSGSCITTEYRCRVSVSILTGWSTVAPRSTSSATLASTVATISSIGAERSATKMSKWNRVLPVFFSGTGWNQILGPSPAGSTSLSM